MRRALLCTALLGGCSPPPAAPPAATTSDAPVASSSAREAQPPRDFAAQVSQSRLSDDVVVVAKPRPPGSDAWRTVQDLCATRLSAAGFEVTRTEGTGPVNVVGVKRGTSRPQEHVLLSAHYDHLADCPGADDNASGVAGVLESARVLGGGSFSRTLVVALWDGEEAGMLGSRAWVKAAKAADMTIRAALVLEMIGYRSLEPKTQELPAGFDLLFPEAVQRIHARQQTGDFIALIHNPKAARASALLVEEARRHGLPVEPLDVPPALVALPAASDLLRSDHAPFWSAGYPAVQLTDTAEFRNPYYHCEVGPDAAETLDYPFMASVVRMVVGATARLLDEP